MPPVKPSPLVVLVATAAALLAFAANSLLCRAALRPHLIDPASFTAVRILSGAAMLLLIVSLRSGLLRLRYEGNWPSAAALFGYAIAFSLAYDHLTAGIGALVLFGSVQATMIGWGLMRGEASRMWDWIGLASAVAGLMVLVVPSDQRASLYGIALMAIAGASWGIYSLRGRGAQDPLAATAGNFLRAAPLSLLALVLLWPTQPVESRGVLLAMISGAITSGLGYVVWYYALPHLTAMRAALVQLLVPVLTAALAVVFLGEKITLPLGIAATLVLGGIGMTLVMRHRK